MSNTVSDKHTSQQAAGNSILKLSHTERAKTRKARMVFAFANYGENIRHLVVFSRIVQFSAPLLLRSQLER